MVKTFIELEMFSSVIKVMTNMFIALDGPTDAGEGIIVFTKGHTHAGIVPGFSCPMDVPPKPPNIIDASKSLVHDDHV